MHKVDLQEWVVKFKTIFMKDSSKTTCLMVGGDISTKKVSIGASGIRDCAMVEESGRITMEAMSKKETGRWVILNDIPA